MKGTQVRKLAFGRQTESILEGKQKIRVGYKRCYSHYARKSQQGLGEML